MLFDLMITEALHIPCQGIKLVHSKIQSLSGEVTCPEMAFVLTALLKKTWKPHVTEKLTLFQVLQTSCSY